MLRGKCHVLKSYLIIFKEIFYRTKEFAEKTKPSTECTSVGSFPDVVSGQCLKLKKKDNNWIPYIETQEVIPQPMMALSGAGITHKGHDNCGGYLAPVALTLSDYYTRSVGYEREFSLRI
jgi:hypothetical protein